MTATTGRHAVAVVDFSGTDVVVQRVCNQAFRGFTHQHPERALEPVGNERRAARR